MKIQIVDKLTPSLESSKGLHLVEEIKSKSLVPPTNKGLIIQGNNLDVMVSLLNDYKGKIDLIYIDPPYLTGLDFKTKDGSFAYTDKFTLDGYLQFIYDRLYVMNLLLSDSGFIYVHVDYRTSSYLKIILDDIFGCDNFRNEIIWSYRSGGASKTFSLPRKHDSIFLYSKDKKSFINSLYERQYLNKSFMGSMKDDSGRDYVDTILRDVLQGEIDIIENKNIKKYNLRPVLNLSSERTGYPTQKPEGLLSLLIKIASKEGDLIADFFCGSGTTLSVAQKLNRDWVGVDIGDESIKTIRDRMVKLDSNFQIKELK